MIITVRLFTRTSDMSEALVSTYQYTRTWRYSVMWTRSILFPHHLRSEWKEITRTVR